MGKLTLFRGIAVTAGQVNQIKERILNTGMPQPGRGKKWTGWKDVRDRLALLCERPDLDLSMTRDLDSYLPVEFACGDLGGATYYACKHHAVGGTVGLVIIFDADRDDIFIDGRDFLAIAFQRSEAVPRYRAARRTALLSDLYGKAIRNYWERAISRDKDSFEYRMAMYDLASLDPEVVSSHLANAQPIFGRHGTRFCSAFVVRSPIPAVRIRDVVEGRPTDIPQGGVHLQAFLR